ncbi:MAG: lipid IV(A) 3-deoxy-D-manno-octulosonic acid transferase [Burkholderiales bacterium]|nr:lipid IV(A) 3-deoxy-D-manno-octulosonic acid transferase [Burkholderiales bacterium]
MSPDRARRLYSLAWRLGRPLVALYLLWRGLRQPEYRQHWSERFGGAGAQPTGRPVLWVHAVSVGETRAAQPLLEALFAARPDLHVVLTHMTPTGRAVGGGLAKQFAGRVVQRYLPYELSDALTRFFDETRPSLGVVLETEIWPNLLHAARAQQVPMVLVNARLSARSLARGQRFAPLLREAARAFTRVLAQTPADAERLAALYDGPIEVVGNLKFDLLPPRELIDAGQRLRVTLGPAPVWLAASTREGEEAMILDAYKDLLSTKSGSDPDFRATLLIVPRHPQRFDEVARLIESKGFAVSRRSRDAWTAPAVQGTVLLGDSMGELALYYGLADVTLMGGSLGPFGSQNLIESCSCGTPVILGPSIYNFSFAAEQALAAGAAVQVSHAADALRLMAQLAREPQRMAQMRAAAQAFAAEHRGATAATVERLLVLLPPAPASGAGGDASSGEISDAAQPATVPAPSAAR